ncbi:chitobiase/beta-hexosaminidase C-terminal domain-containing protein [uncultured Dokdonia sp.]|uniref:chitobiase/beta-hexosaminidase C-terminal domain-containing protein n=1 Tax=uncultured Dokdonia sp. TaxID=575653 RepID=UPI002611CC30|nr:chitobiase/beta-hexosaminidase C-terminal domain-containing protein [uncultured Dokdonia sp.]
MRLGILIILFISILSCAKKTEPVDSIFVQQQEISIAQPRVTATSTIIDSTVKITAALALEDVAIYYTTDGAVPTENNTKYTVPITVQKEGKYAFKAFHPDWKPSETTTLKLYKKGITPRKMDWQTTAHTTYPGVGPMTVLNQKKASLNFKDQQWMGYDSLAFAKAYFDKKPFIKSMTIGYLIDTKSWIFPPEKVVVLLNEKDTLQIDIPKTTEGETPRLDDVYIPINKEIERVSIRVYNTSKLPEWHPGKGLKAWLFMDEWIFNE